MRSSAFTATILFAWLPIKTEGTCGDETCNSNEAALRKFRSYLETNQVSTPSQWKEGPIYCMLNFLGLAKNRKDTWFVKQGGKPVNLTIGIYVESLSSIRSTRMSFEVDIYLRQTWKDKRFKLDREKHLTLTNPMINLVWTPDLYFANAKATAFQTVTQSNQMMLVHPDGSFHFSTRILGEIACNLKLRSYPMDHQECEIRILSYAYPMTELNIQWFKTGAIALNPNILLPEMKIVGNSTDYCNGYYSYGHTANVTLKGNFSCLLAKLQFQRQVGYHLVQTYIPQGLIVAISWISFWIDPAAIPARISLSFTTLLTLATMSAGVRNSLPPVAYAKAIDYWVGTCTLFVFLALLQFALVNSICRKAAKLRTYAEMLLQDPDSVPAKKLSGRKPVDRLPSINFSTEDISTEDITKKAAKFQKIAVGIDSWCRLCFPLAFVIFNVVYWLTFN